MNDINFDFISDDGFREILERDFEELHKCIEIKASKSVLVLSGSIIEALLLEFFSSYSSELIESEKLLKYDLYKLLELAEKENLISSDSKSISTIIKDYRNLIHPGREIRKKQSFDNNTAEIAKNLLYMIIEEIRENYLEKVGYSAADVFQKIKKEALSAPIYDIFIGRLHKTEKNKLYNLLIEDELTPPTFKNEISGIKRYIKSLKTHIDRETIEKQLKQLIHKIENGEKWEVMKYYSILFEDLPLLNKNDIELIILYVMSALKLSTYDFDEFEMYSNEKLFSSFGIHLNSTTSFSEFLDLAVCIVSNHKKNDYSYFGAYDQLVNSVSNERKEEVKEYVIRKAGYVKAFYLGYDDGNFLPF